MSHADTIRDALDLVAAEKPWTTQDAHAALDALLAKNQRLENQRDEAFVSVSKREAEIQRLCEALERVAYLLPVATWPLLDQHEEALRLAREALAGDAE